MFTHAHARLWQQLWTDQEQEMRANEGQIRLLGEARRVRTKRARIVCGNRFADVVRLGLPCPCVPSRRRA